MYIKQNDSNMCHFYTLLFKVVTKTFFAFAFTSTRRAWTDKEDKRLRLGRSGTDGCVCLFKTVGITVHKQSEALTHTL